MDSGGGHVKAIETSVRIVALLGQSLGRMIPRGTGGRAGATLLCELCDGVARCIVLDADTQDPRAVVIDSPTAAGELLSQLKGPVTVVALLPRRDYLVKTLALPSLAEDELADAVALETEAMLPADFGAAEVSYRLCGAGEGSLSRYELYIARQSRLQAMIDSLGRLGLTADLVLPSAVVWNHVLASPSRADLLILRWGCDGQAEAAWMGQGGCTNVRALRLPPAGGETELSAPLAECLRSALAENPSRNGHPFTVGWVGQGCPGQPLGRVVFENISQAVADDGAVSPALALAAKDLRRNGTLGALGSANLVPREVLARRRTLAIYRQLGVAAATLMLAGLLAAAAMKIAIFRQERSNQALAARIASIKSEGETVERREAQLEAIAAMRRSGNSLFLVVSGLADATPEGVSYSQVELTGEGTLRLVGQAASVSQPFLLPEQLEKQPQFKQVVLQSIGQKKPGSGSATEFRMDCKLVRKGP